MKTLTDTAQYLTEALAILVIYRLFNLPLRRDKLYRLFAVFLGLQLIESLAYFACVHWAQLDYRKVWMSLTVAAILLSPSLVFFLLKAVLAEIPGVMQFSQRLFLVIFPIAVVIAFWSARFEYGATNKADLSTPAGRLVSFFAIADKATALVLVIVLIFILGFILWFPVKMSRNLAVFSFGFVIYFTAKSGLELFIFYSKFSSATREATGLVASFVVVACLAYWLIFIDSKGETIHVRMGHSWHVAEQAKLVDRLESMNGILLRSAHRLQQ